MDEKKIKDTLGRDILVQRLRKKYEKAAFKIAEGDYMRSKMVQPRSAFIHKCWKRNCYFFSRNTVITSEAYNPKTCKMHDFSCPFFYRNAME